MIKQPISSGYIIDGKFVEDKNGYISIWKQPEKGAFYVMGGDVAEGLATGDYSCLIVLDEKLDICASWYGHIAPDLLGDEAIKLGQAGKNSPEEVCVLNSGKWILEQKECEGISKNACETSGGTFNECASACRNNPDAEFCVAMCVPVCKYQ